MAVSIRLLRRRIKTAKNIAQITRAMEMVAASKVRRAQEQAISGKPYAQKLVLLVKNLVGRIEEGTHPYLEGEKQQAKAVAKTLVLLICSDKGLAGSFNTNLFRTFLSFRSERYSDIEVLLVGRKLLRGVVRAGVPIVADFPFGTTLPSFESVLPIARFVVDSFLGLQYSKVIVIYTNFVSLQNQAPLIFTLLPVSKELKEENSHALLPYTFEPSAAVLLSQLLPHYLESTLYQILLESYASEQASRMRAMHEASENAKDVIWDLTLLFNKARQERITSELLDIAGGVEGVVAI